MTYKIYIRINEKEFLWSLDNDFLVSVKESDRVVIGIELKNYNSIPIVYLEDYKIDIWKKNDLTFESSETLLFRECFGLSHLRFYFNDEIDPVILAFDVHVKKINAKQIEEMISYLFQFSEKIINLCFSRSSLAVGSKSEENSDPETILTVAEQFINKILEMRLELHYHLRKRLVPVRTPMWQAHQFHADIDPYDVLYNLDNLIPVPIDGDVIINGRLYSVESVDITTLQAISDVEENAVLLGGIYSIRQKLMHLFEQLQLGAPARYTSIYDVEYVSIDRLLVSVTMDGMLLRCRYLIEQSEELIRYFQSDLKVIYHGELRPKVTPYVRGSRVYRVLFEQIAKWYELGSPSLDGLKYLIKLKSVAKIYEIFAFIKLIEFFHNSGWNITNAKKHEILRDAIPSQVDFEKEDIKINLMYEPKISPFIHRETNHLDLVDVHHTNGREYAYWLPDFILRISYKIDVIYAVLDAKYSYRSSIINYALPEIHRKYGLGLSVFDENLQVFDSAKIVAILAIYPDDYNKSPLSYWPKHGLDAPIPKLPMVGAIALSVGWQESFERLINRVVDIAVKKLGVR